MSTKRTASATPSSLTRAPKGYTEWIADVKQRVRAAQMRASLAVNHELIALYWSIGRDILEKQKKLGWGAGVVDRASADLRTEFPNMQGFSRANMMYMRAFAKAWPSRDAIVQQAVGQLPWGTNLVLLTKLKTRDERLAYAASAVEHGWSRAMLTIHIEQGTVERTGKALTNFERTLPKPVSDLARESLKDPYRFDFLSLGAEAGERALEDGLVGHISKFLLELGAGFAYVGRQVPIEIDGRDFFLDLLFYHLHLRCFVVVELKGGEFQPEHVGKLNFYLSAVDTQLRREHDAPSIGLLLVKTRSRVFAEYALRDTTKPMGVAEYQLKKALPKKLEASLPSIAQIEAELAESKATTRSSAKKGRAPKKRTK
ncbi:PDDEXK nuclease domain-containing protein [Chondromyces apiculatus]|uniref:Putative cytoplasmic protein n=1 Tax=Chondromyces apiculatus DSM 436 TaxID=1192034 RepID=A0A017TG58_9BACT|nr:PDDEXK nuclease domain-containing protein [Chondromyces apiculatus]EYF08229.1 Putative cytoplasmic protein [Chondromyces apiculatus DSM 436]